MHKSGSTREWYNSVYSFNDDYIKSLVYKDNLIKNLFRSYFNIIYMSKLKKSKIKLKRINRKRFSNKKLILSRSEIKHTNNKVIFTLYMYNNNNRIIFKLLKKVYNSTKIKNFIKNISDNVKNIKKRTKLFNRRLFFLRFLLKRILLSLIKLYIIFNYKIRKNPIKRKRKLLRMIKRLLNYLYYSQLIMFNRYKFTYFFLNYKGFGLINILSKIYKKKIEFNIINLKSVHLNSDIFSKSIAVKLYERKNNLLKILKKALNKVKLAKWHEFIYYKPTTFNKKEDILNSIKYKYISGTRFEASGRLTRRLIASRSIFKVRYVGTLRNIYSSYNKLSNVMLRGYVKSSLQYTLINSNTANGAFGLKGWVNTF